MANDEPQSPDRVDEDGWLTVYEVAGQLLARPETVKTWIREGRLPAEDRGRLGLRVPKREVEAFIITHFQYEGFRSADHSFSSGVGEAVLAATDIPEQAVERQGAGWPFRRDGPGPDTPSGTPSMQGGL
jgi:excisionase family DNA binding protein